MVLVGIQELHQGKGIMIQVYSMLYYIPLDQGMEHAPAAGRLKNGGMPMHAHVFVR